MTGTRASLARFGALGVALVLSFLGVLLVAHGPAWCLRLGDLSLSLDLVDEELGDDVPVLLTDRHDGEWYWNLARDPLLTDAEGLEQRLDRPFYRAQRIGYPMLAAPWRLGGEMALVWGLVVTNIAALLAGTLLTARLCERFGCRPAAVLALPLSPVAIVSVTGDLPDLLAVTALLLALLAALDDRPLLCGAAAVMAVLAKDASWLGLAGLAALGPGLSRRSRIALVLPSAVAGAAWAGYVRLRLDAPGAEVQEFDWVPLRGLVRTWTERWEPAGSLDLLLLALLLLALSAFVVVRFVQRRSVLLAMAVPFAAITPFLTPQVLDLPLNSLRAIGPMVTLVALDELSSRRGAREPALDVARAPYPRP